MKRPEGFDEGPAQPEAPVEHDRAPRERRVPRLPRLPVRRGAGTDQEARPAPAPSDPEPKRPTPATTGLRAPHPTADVAPPHDGARRPQEGATPDDDDRDASEHGEREHVATVTDVVDATTASRPSSPERAEEAPIGARVRAAETAREAR
ncbi:MAG: hypothetical protein AAGC90_15905, partial [Curtobacterium sp.]